MMEITPNALWMPIWIDGTDNQYSAQHRLELSGSVVGIIEEGNVSSDSGCDMPFGGAANDDLDGGASGGDECNGQLGTDTATADCEVVSNVP